jgi:hypothetical protein
MSKADPGDPGDRPAATGRVLTIVAHTRGHHAAVERFAVTGVRSG